MSSQLESARLLITLVRARAAAARREGRSEIGASALEWAIISAIISGIAVILATTIGDRVTGWADQIAGG